MSAPIPSYVRRATFVDPVDGDSFWLRLDHGRFPSTRSEDTIHVRVKDLWCPELNEPDGPEAAKFTTDTLAGAQRIIAQTYKGSFARTVADVWVDDVLLAHRVIAAKLGSATREGLVGSIGKRTHQPGWGGVNE